MLIECSIFVSFYWLLTESRLFGVVPEVLQQEVVYSKHEQVYD